MRYRPGSPLAPPCVCINACNGHVISLQFAHPIVEGRKGTAILPFVPWPGAPACVLTSHLAPLFLFTLNRNLQCKVATWGWDHYALPLLAHLVGSCQVAGRVKKLVIVLLSHPPSAIQNQSGFLGGGLEGVASRVIAAAASTLLCS